VTHANQLAGAHQYELALEKYYTALELYDLLNAQFADIDGGDGQQRLDTQKDTAKTLNNLAAVLHQLKRFDEAMEAYSQALETKKMSLGQDHFSVGRWPFMAHHHFIVLLLALPDHARLSLEHSLTTNFIQAILFTTW
jgi:Tetratricopeptide repeat.